MSKSRKRRTVRSSSYSDGQARRRVFRARGAPISWISLARELQGDWARLETVPAIVQIVLTERLIPESASG